MEPPKKRQCLLPSLEQQHQQYQESSDDDDDIFYATPVPSHNARKETGDPIVLIRDAEKDDNEDAHKPAKTASDPISCSEGEIEVLDSGEEVSDLDEEAIHSRRSQALNKVRTRWDEIIAKYGQEFENADVININTLEVVEDNGHIKKMKDENDAGVAKKRRDMRAAREEEEHERELEALGNNHGRGNRLLDRQKYGDRHRSYEAKDHQSLTKDYQHNHNHGHKRRSDKSPQKKRLIYEDSSDDDFLYEKSSPTPSTSVSRRPLQCQSSNQIRRDRPRTSFVEKRTVITTKTITTSRIRDDRQSHSLSSRQSRPFRGSSSRQLSHERTSREIKHYRSSQQETESSEEELVQRESAREPTKEAMIKSQKQHKLESRALRSPSPPGRQSLWLPGRAPGRPPKAYIKDSLEPPRRVKEDVEKRTRKVVYEGPKRPRGRPRKVPMLQQGSTDSAAEDSSATADTNTAINPFRKAAPPMVFARNVVPNGYDFSDEYDELPQPSTSVQLSSAAQSDAFPALDDALVAAEDGGLQLPCQEQPAPVEASQPAPDNSQTPKPPHNVETLPELHQSIIDTYSTTPCFYSPRAGGSPEGLDEDPNPASAASPKNASNLPTAAAISETELDDLSIPIDPALLAIDAYNAEKRAKSLKRAQAELEEQAMREFCDAEILVEHAPVFEGDEGIAGDEADNQGNRTLEYMLGQLEQRESEDGSREVAEEQDVVWDDESDDDLEAFLVPISRHHGKYAPVVKVEAEVELGPTQEENQPLLPSVSDQNEDKREEEHIPWLNEGEGVSRNWNVIEDAILPSTPEVGDDLALALLDGTDNGRSGKPPSAEFIPVSFFPQPAELTEPVSSQPAITSQNAAPANSQIDDAADPPFPAVAVRFDANKEIPDSQADSHDEELVIQPAFSSSAPSDVAATQQTRVEVVDEPAAPQWSPWRGLEDDGELGADTAGATLGLTEEDNTELHRNAVDQQEKCVTEEVCRLNSTDPGYIGKCKEILTDSGCGGLFVSQSPSGSPGGQAEEEKSEDEIELVSSIPILDPKSESSTAMKKVKEEEFEGDDDEDELSLQPARQGTHSLSNPRSQQEPTCTKTPNASSRTSNDAIRTYARSQRSKSRTPAPLIHFSLSVSPNGKIAPKATPKLKNRLLSEAASCATSSSPPASASLISKSATPSGRTTNASRHPSLSRSMSPVPMSIRSPKSRADIQARARAENEKAKLESGRLRRARV